jgi:hypothetical protein
MSALRFVRHIPALVVMVLASACGERPDADGVVRQPIPRGIDPSMVEWRSDGVLIASQDSMRKTPGYVVDSVFSPEENLRRFQATVTGPAPTRLRGGAASTDALMRNYWALLVARDTLAMTPLIVSRAEYAYLYFPESIEGANGMPPHIGWELILSQTGRGLTRALTAASRGDATVLRTECSDTPQRAGRNTVYGPCGVVIRRNGIEETIWLTKTLIERDGVHKLLGLQNELSGG